MSERQQFRVITFGQLIPNRAFSDVVKGVILEFSLSPAKATALCRPCREARTLSRDLSLEQAQQMSLTLNKLGLIAQIMPANPPVEHKPELVFTFEPLSERDSSTRRTFLPKTAPSLPASSSPDSALLSTLASSSTPTAPNNALLSPVEVDTSGSSQGLDTPSWQTMDSLREIPLRFTGNVSEFTHLWHRHWFLSLLSLGLFLPWAQVRQQRYLWSRLSVDGVAFDYWGKPWELLWSQLAIVFGVALFAVGTVSSMALSLMPMPVNVATQISGLVLLILASRFRFFYHWRHLSVGNQKIHWFGFQGYAYFYVLFAPLFSLITIGILTPYSVYAIHSDQVNRLCIGRTFAQFDGVLSDYFDCGFRALAWVVALYIGIAMVLVVTDWQYWWMGGLFGLTVLWVAVQYLRQQYFILALKSTDVDGVGFDVSDRFFSMASHAADLFIMIFTLGLATPWVRYRRWQGYCDHLRFLYAGSLATWLKSASTPPKKNTSSPQKNTQSN